MCLTTVKSLKNPTTVTSISGSHIAGKSDVDVMGSTTYKYPLCPSHPFQMELKSFSQIFNFTIDSITFEPFPLPFPNLIHIAFGGNKITTPKASTGLLNTPMRGGGGGKNKQNFLTLCAQSAMSLSDTACNLISLLKL